MNTNRKEFPINYRIIIRVEYISRDEGHPITEDGIILEWMPGNPISDNDQDVEHMNAEMDDAKYEDSS